MVYIIYSREETTEFLFAAISIIAEKYSDFVSIFEYSNLLQRDECYSFILNVTELDFFFFLGHGASHQLYGPLDDLNEKSVLISKDNYPIFFGKQFFCLSCDSNVLIKKLGLKYGVGFGDLPTDWKHVRNLRDIGDANIYLGLNELIVEEFNSILNKLLCSIIDDLVVRGLSFKEVHDFYRLRLNKVINKLLLLKKENRDSALIRLLFQVRDELEFFRN